jgi:ubiquinone biosynthesis monooxygenase Coq6
VSPKLALKFNNDLFTLVFNRLESMIRAVRRGRKGPMGTGPARLSSSSSTQISDSYDVLVCGGGVVGVAVVSNLLRLLGPGHENVKIGIVDSRGPQSLASCQEKKGYDLRVYALAPQSIQLLQDVGAWKYIEPRSQPYTNMQVWDHEGPGVVKFSASESGLEELGRMAEDSTIQAALYQTLEDKGFQVDRIFGSTVTSLKVRRGFAQEPAELTISPLSKESGAEEAKHVTARLVVGADGAMSPVRKLADISSWGWNYGQEGLVCTVGTEAFHTTAWQRYLGTGPLALLPLWQQHKEDRGGHSSIVWSVPVSEAKRLKELSEEAFLEELNAALAPGAHSDKWSVFEPHDGMMDSSKGLPLSLSSTPLSALKKEIAALADSVMSASVLSSPPNAPPLVTSLAGPRVSFPLQLQQAQTYCASRVALAGDAAHSIHPQAGQGLNLGLGDSRCLSETVAAALAAGSDIGDIAVLRPYASKRYAENLAVMGAVDLINTLFKPALVGGEGATKAKAFLRSAGMLGIHALPGLKSRVVRTAAKMGMKGVF